MVFWRNRAYADIYADIYGLIHPKVIAFISGINSICCVCIIIAQFFFLFWDGKLNYLIDSLIKLDRNLLLDTPCTGIAITHLQTPKTTIQGFILCSEKINHTTDHNKTCYLHAQNFIAIITKQMLFLWITIVHTTYYINEYKCARGAPLRKQRLTLFWI
jgi:hypothetical protein